MALEDGVKKPNKFTRDIVALLSSICGLAIFLSFLILFVTNKDASQIVGLFLLWSPPLFAIIGMVLARKTKYETDKLKKLGRGAGILCLILWITFMVGMLPNMVGTF